MTEFSPATKEAQLEFDKKDTLFRRVLLFFLVYAAIVMTVGTVYSVLTNYQIERNQATNSAASKERFQRYVEQDTKQNAQIKSYILCIFKVLTVPIDQRDPNAATACSDAADKASGTTTSGAGSTTVPLVVSGALPTNSQENTTPTTTQPTPTGPPDPDVDNSTFLNRLPLLGGLFKSIGL